MSLADSLLFSADEYRQLPEAGPRYQLIEGFLEMAPAPNRYHQDISRNVFKLLLDYLETHPLGVLYDAPFDVYLTDRNVFQPDLVLVRNEHRHILTDAGAEGVPDLVIEILSPATAGLDRKEKLNVYARVGVPELWLIDPVAQTVAVFTQPSFGAPAAVHGFGVSFTSSQLPGLTIATATVFARP